MNYASPVRDMTAKTSAGGGGSDMRLMFMCGTAQRPHKGLRTGAKFLGVIPLVCPACNAKESK